MSCKYVLGETRVGKENLVIFLPNNSHRFGVYQKQSVKVENVDKHRFASQINRACKENAMTCRKRQKTTIDAYLRGSASNVRFEDLIINSGNRKVNRQAERMLRMDGRAKERRMLGCFRQAARLVLPSSVGAGRTCAVAWPYFAGSLPRWTYRTSVDGAVGEPEPR